MGGDESVGQGERVGRGRGVAGMARKRGGGEGVRRAVTERRGGEKRVRGLRKLARGGTRWGVREGD